MYREYLVSGPLDGVLDRGRERLECAVGNISVRRVCLCRLLVAAEEREKDRVDQTCTSNQSNLLDLSKIQFGEALSPEECM